MAQVETKTKQTVKVTVDYLPASEAFHGGHQRETVLEAIRSEAMAFFGVADRQERDTYRYYLEHGGHSDHGYQRDARLGRRRAHARRALQPGRGDHARSAGVARRKRVTPHTLRHVFASELLSAGANPRQIQELLGRKHLDSTQRYVHVTAHGLRGAIKRLQFPPTHRPQHAGFAAGTSAYSPTGSRNPLDNRKARRQGPSEASPQAPGTTGSAPGPRRGRA